MRSPWQILGVAPHSDLDEAKRAYRKLARRYHPDVNKEPDARERFQEIQWAMREIETGYSEGNLTPNTNGNQRAAAGAAHGAATAAPRTEGVPVKVVNLTFAQAFDGLRTELMIAVPMTCDRCGGSGKTSADGRFCVSCRGFGKRLGENGSEKCLPCDGTGYANPVTCKNCENGVVVRSRPYFVEVPPGVTDGARFEAFPAGGRAGDPATIIVRVASSGMWERKGDSPDLWLDLPVTYSEACLGAQVNVPTPDKAVMLKLPAGTAPGKIFRIAERGMPRPEGGRGDLYVRISIVVPEDLTAQQKKLIHDLQKHDEDPRKQLFGR